MKRLLLLALLPFLGGQVIVESPVFTNVTISPTVHTIGLLDDGYVRGQPTNWNNIYTDTSLSWIPNAIPASQLGLPAIQTRTDEKATTGDTTLFSATVSARGQLVVWHADSEVTKPTWLSNDYTNCGLQVAMPQPATSWCRTVTAGTYNFGGNCKTGGCDTTNSPMYVVSLVPAWRPLETSIPVSPPGFVHFEQSSYTVDEGTTLTFFVTRTEGSSGAANVTIAEGTNPGNGVLNTTFRSWLDGAAGPRQGTVDIANVSSNQIMTLEITNVVGAVPGSPLTLTINITDTGGGGGGGSPPAAGDYYVNPTSTCNDAYVGQSRTFVSGSNGPWCSVDKCNTIVAAASGNRTCWVEGGGTGQYREYGGNILLNFANSGVNTSRKLRTCAIGGHVRLKNTLGSYMAYSMYANTDWIQYGGCDLTNFLETDGGLAYGVNCSRGQNPETECGARVGRIAEINGDHVTLGFRSINSPGWTGILINPTATDLRLVPPFSLVGPHGTPILGTNEDSGDFLVTSREPPIVSALMDGCIANSTGINTTLGGHGMDIWGDRQVLKRCVQANNSWANVPTFGSINGIPDGNRAQIFSQNARDSLVHDYVINRTGRPADHPWTECFKHEGQYNTIIVAVIKNCVGHGINAGAYSGSFYNRENVYAHMIFERLGSVVAAMIDESDNPLRAPLAPMEKLYFKNIILRLWTQNPLCCNGKPPGFATPNQMDVIFYFYFAPNRTLADVLFMDGWTIQHPSGSCNNVYIYMNNGPHSGKRPLTELMTLYPDNIKNITCTTDANLDNAPAAGTDIFGHQIANYYRPVNDTLSLGAGSHLTYAASQGVNTVNLDVENVLYFPDPISDTDGTSWGAPAIGQFSGAYQVHIAGVGNVTYTDRQRTAGQHSGRLVLSSPQSWSNGANVNLKIPGGAPFAIPNRGAVL